MPRPTDLGLAHLLLGQPNLSESLMRALALKGALPEYLAREFQASVNLLDLTTREFQYLRRVNSWLAGINQVAVVGEFGIAVLGPRATQGREAIAVVDSVMIENTSGGSASFRYGLIRNNNVGSAAPTSNGIPLDDRIGPLSGTPFPNPIFGVGGGSQVADPAITFAGHVSLPVSSSIELNVSAVLTGLMTTTGLRTYFGVWATSPNIAFACNFRWRERELLPSEIT